MAAKLIIEVVAGLVPNQPMPEHTRRFCLTSEDFEAGAQEQRAAWDRVHGEALMYMLRLMDPQGGNWVRLDWIWL